jgi:hypothetical protein
MIREEMGVGVLNMMKIRRTGERGIACRLIHLGGISRRQESPDMNKNDAIALDVVVLGNCGSGKILYSPENRQNASTDAGHRGIRRDEDGAWEPLVRTIQSDNYQISRGRKADKLGDGDHLVVMLL